MKLIGGNFGASGDVYLTYDNKIIVSGATSRNYKASDITSITSIQQKESKFGITGFIIGTLLFGTIGFILANGIGLIVALIITIAGSFYSRKTNVVTIALIDGNSVIINASNSQIKELHTAKSKPLNP